MHLTVHGQLNAHTHSTVRSRRSYEGCCPGTCTESQTWKSSTMKDAYNLDMTCGGGRQKPLRLQWGPCFFWVLTHEHAHRNGVYVWFACTHSFCAHTHAANMATWLGCDKGEGSGGLTLGAKSHGSMPRPWPFTGRTDSFDNEKEQKRKL